MKKIYINVCILIDKELLLITLMKISWGWLSLCMVVKRAKHSTERESKALKLVGFLVSDKN